MGRILSMDAGKESALKLIETANSGQHISCCGHSERINPMLGEVAEWEIPWEDLEIGERIGIGKNSFFNLILYKEEEPGGNFRLENHV
jgi:sterile alpha motif and leucine zipper-containing kinase AZK